MAMINKETKILENLEDFGLKPQEAKVYLANLRLGQSSVGAISQEAQIQRTFVYDILRSLIKRGLASYNIINGVNQYSVVSIDRFKKAQDRKLQELEELMPEIRVLQRSVGERAKVQFFEGREGLLEAQFDTLNIPKGEKILAYAASEGLYYEDNKFARNYIKERVKKRIHVRAILPASPALKKHIENDEKELRESVVLDAEKFPFTNEIDIYGNKIAILSYSGDLHAVIIESESIAKTQKLIFELAWTGAERLNKKGREEKIGVTQKAFVFDGKGKFLIIRRTETAPSKPNKWDLPGGAIDFGEDPIDSIHREIKEETGLEIEGLRPFDTTSKVDEDGEFWTTIAYCAKAKSNNVKLSFEHNDLKWVTFKEFSKYTDSKRFLKFLTALKN